MPATRAFSARMLIAALGFTVCGTAVAVQDEDFNFDTTEDLYQVCSTAEDVPAYLTALVACRAFIEATVQYHDAVSDRKKMKRLICYPDSATVEQGRLAFVAWAEDKAGDAEMMGEMPVVGLVRSLAAKYPCR